MPSTARPRRREVSDHRRRIEYERRDPRYCALSFEEYKQQIMAYPPDLPAMPDQSLAHLLGGLLLLGSMSAVMTVWLVFALILNLVTVPASSVYPVSSVHFVPPVGYQYNITSSTSGFTLFSYSESVQLSNVTVANGSVAAGSYGFNSGYDGRCSYSVFTEITSIFVLRPSSRADNIPSGEQGLQLTVPGCGGLWVARLSTLMLAVLVMPLGACLLLTLLNLVQQESDRETYERDTQQAGLSAATQTAASSAFSPSSSAARAPPLRAALLSAFMQRSSSASTMAAPEPADVEQPGVPRAPMPSLQQMTDWHVQRSQRGFLSYRKKATWAKALSTTLLVVALIDIIASPAWASSTGYAQATWAPTLYVHVAALAVTIALMVGALLWIARMTKREERQQLTLTFASGSSYL